MSEALARGYTMERVFLFIESHFDAATTARAFDSLPANTAALRSEIKPAAWYPREHLVHLYQVIVDNSGTAKEAYEALVKCGMFMSAEATNTYLRVLMKLLTPGLLAKKLPSFWDRDFKGGIVQTDASEVADNRLKVQLTDIEGFDHCAGVATGFIRFVLEAMGKKNVQYSQEGWSLSNPGPRSVALDIRWS